MRRMITDTETLFWILLGSVPVWLIMAIALQGLSDDEEDDRFNK